MKRAIDILLSLMALALLAVPIVFVALAVYLKLGSPVIFRQVRPGLHGLPFEILKFRTMTDDRDGNEVLLPDADRIPRFGRFLRSSSLDELPALWSVLKGDMSLVGPRPLLVEYLPLYSSEQARRHEVRPGITGWAQINGRNAITWEEKFELDVWYVDNRSMLLDLKILLITLVKVFKKEGISPAGQVTMDKFTGSKSC